MPWCDDCSKFWNPPDMRPGGRCPSCGRRLAAAPAGPADGPVVQAAAEAAGAPEVAAAKGAPWHFKLLLVGVSVYMVYRIYWLIEWLPKHL